MTGTSDWKSKFIAATVCFIAVNLCIVALVAHGAAERKKTLTKEEIANSVSEAKQQGTWTWWVARGYVNRPTPPDVVLMGSSQMAAAAFSAAAKTINKDIDTVTDREDPTLPLLLAKSANRNVSAYNLAMGGAMISDQLMMERALFTPGHLPKLVVIGLNPRDFIDNHFIAASSTEQFQFFAPYVDLGPLSAVAFNDYFGQLDWTIHKYLPIKHLIKTSRAKEFSPDNSASISSNTTARGKLMQAISGTSGDVRKGLWVISCALPFPFVDNTFEYKKRYENPDPSIYSSEKAFFERLLSDLHSKGVQVLVVGMPSIWPNRALLPNSFWSSFRQYIASTTQANHADWIDLSDNPVFNINDYIDTVHLNATGGRKLLNIIGARIAFNNQLIGCLRQPTHIQEVAGIRTANKL